MCRKKPIRPTRPRGLTSSTAHSLDSRALLPVACVSSTHTRSSSYWRYTLTCGPHMSAFSSPQQRPREIVAAAWDHGRLFLLFLTSNYKNRAPAALDQSLRGNCTKPRNLPIVGKAWGIAAVKWNRGDAIASASRVDRWTSVGHPGTEWGSLGHGEQPDSREFLIGSTSPSRAASLQGWITSRRH